MTSVWMNPPHIEKVLDGDIPDYTIDRLSDLLPIVEGWQ
jgi:FMN phosphatase YigB (HAD superfamily)